MVIVRSLERPTGHPEWYVVATSAAVLVYEAVRQRMGGEARP